MMNDVNDALIILFYTNFWTNLLSIFNLGVIKRDVLAVAMPALDEKRPHSENLI